MQMLMGYLLTLLADGIMYFGILWVSPPRRKSMLLYRMLRFLYDYESSFDGTL